ncbi:MAG: nucleotidyltransferase domain-containing protein [Planctomycetes bacterium]|nr:nucleotidyltransferase domain-containing protein [Planctomycetota bacterium]
MRQTIKDVVASVAYDRIVLFGSHARGDNTEQSDVDVLVILKRALPMPDRIRLSTELRAKFAERLVDADVLIKDCQEVEYLKAKCGSVVRNALMDGILL